LGDVFFELACYPDFTPPINVIPVVVVVVVVVPVYFYHEINHVALKDSLNTSRVAFNFVFIGCLLYD